MRQGSTGVQSTGRQGRRQQAYGPKTDDSQPLWLFKRTKINH